MSDPPASIDRTRSALPKGREAFLVAGGVTGATFIAMHYVFDPDRAGSPMVLVIIGALYAALAAFGAWRLHSRGELKQDLRPKSGDLALGALIAGVLYGGAQLVHLWILPPGSLREGWLRNVYFQIGSDPEAANHIGLMVALFVIGGLEEFVWRGLVMRALETAMSARAALVVSSILFGLAHVSTITLLRSPGAGLNPLLPLAAAGCGFVWGTLVLRTNRLVPALFAHALFTYAVVEWPIWTP